MCKGVIFVSKKKRIIYAVIGTLVTVVIISVVLAVIVSINKPDVIQLSDSDSDTEIIEATVKTATEEGMSIPLEDLQPEIEDVINEVKKSVGGEWSVYIVIPKTGDVLSINQKKMQAASVIKLCVMCKAYEEYDELKKEYSDYYDVDELMKDMIVISDNEAADTIIKMLGRGDYKEGLRKVNEFCKENGLTNTVMGRLMSMKDNVNDNYTTSEDMGKLMHMIYEGEFDHSKEMLHLLGKQDRKLKIPAGVPANVRTANKTGELEDVQNDVAIVYTKYPYIISVMADGVSDYQIPIDAVVDISRVTYDYIFEKEEEATWTIE